MTQTFALDRPARGGDATPRPALRRAWFAVLVPWLLGACSALSGGSDAPAPKESTQLDIAIRAEPELNQDIKGRGAPMLVRVYELRSEVAFQDAEFFALQTTDKAVLGVDLLAVDQYIIRPGETRQILRKSHPQTTAIGVFAAYRDLPNATWRVVHTLAPAAEKIWYGVVLPIHQTKLKIALQAKAIVLTDEGVGQDPARYANESMKGLDSTKTPLDGAPQKAGELLQSVPKTADVPTLDGLKGLIKPQ